MARAIADFGVEEDAMQAYFREGEARARALDNRGPIRFAGDGAVHPDIVEAYLRTGFYIFEGVLDAAELAELRAGFNHIVDRLPTEPGSPVDHQGRPALGAGLAEPAVLWSKPLGDPLGGTEEAGGRHPVKMNEPRPAADLPEQIPYVVRGVLQFSDAALRLSAHPGLLAIVTAINGDDFVPYSEDFIIKKPGEGASFAWHQDGITHWDSPDWDALSHGFVLMTQLFECTAANGLWYVPGTHKLGRLDIAALVAEAGSIRLAQAVPLLCNPGDVAISNRQLVHGSFANTSADWRVTLNLGFQRRRSVLGVGARDIHGAPAIYDTECVRKRTEIVGYALDARRQHRPHERAYVYRPHVENGENYRWDEAARSKISGYNEPAMLI